MANHNFRELKVWQRARGLVAQVYAITNEFPESEKFGVTNQIRRAVVSVTCNISEGAGRSTDKDFNHFLNMAYGSSNEVINLMFLSKDLGFLIDETKIINEFDELNRMIRGLQKTLK